MTLSFDLVALPNSSLPNALRQSESLYYEYLMCGSLLVVMVDLFYELGCDDNFRLNYEKYDGYH